MDINDLKKIISSNHINFLIGSGASSPYLKILGNIESMLSELEKYKESDQRNFIEASIKWHYFKSSIERNNIITSDETEEAIKVKNNYKTFISKLNNIVTNRGNKLISKQINLFTTNVDLFLDFSLEESGVVFNDGFFGRSTPIFGAENFNTHASKISTFHEFRSEVPIFNLFKLHGSVNWKILNKDKIGYDYGLTVLKDIIDEDFDENLFLKIPEENISCIKTLMERIPDPQNKSILENFIQKYNKLIMINPTKEKFKTTIINSTYYELLRMYSNYLERENSVLFVFGFSFADEHIRDITLRVAKSNPTLMIIVFAHTYEGRENISNRLPDEPNIKFICPDKGSKTEFDLETINLNFFQNILDVKTN